MKAKSISLGLLLLLLFLIAATPSWASYVLSPTDILANSAGWYVGSGDPNKYSIDHIIDQSGLTKDFISGITDWDRYFDGTAKHSYTTISTGTEWFAIAGDSNITFDLGGSYSLDGLAIWNEDSYGISSFTVWLDNDANKNNGTLFEKTFSVDPNPVFQDYGAQQFGWSNPHAAAYVHFYGVAPESVISMGEIAFKTTHAPLPPSAFLLVTGLMGVVSFRRFKQ